MIENFTRPASCLQNRGFRKPVLGSQGSQPRCVWSVSSPVGSSEAIGRGHGVAGGRSRGGPKPPISTGNGPLGANFGSEIDFPGKCPNDFIDVFWVCFGPFRSHRAGRGVRAVLRGVCVGGPRGSKPGISTVEIGVPGGRFWVQNRLFRKVPK